MAARGRLHAKTSGAEAKHADLVERGLEAEAARVSQTIKNYGAKMDGINSKTSRATAAMEM